MSERFKVHSWKGCAAQNAAGGSNPPLSDIFAALSNQTSISMCLHPKKAQIILALSLLSLFLSQFFLSSCENFIEHDYTIQNNSSTSVTFSIDGYGDALYTLDSGSSISKNLYSNIKLTFYGNPRVSYYSKSDKCVIEDLEYYSYTVTNTTSYEITLSEANNMLGKTYGDTAQIPASTLSSDSTAASTTVIVYTSSPEWLAVFTDTGSDALNFLTFTLTETE